MDETGKSVAQLLADTTWQLWVAIMGAVFAVFALIYRPEFIYYGFLTFAFGIIAHAVFLFWELVLRILFELAPAKRVSYFAVCLLEHLSNFVLAWTWLSCIRFFYFS